MNNFKNIQTKLQEFVKKYYKNELIKGIILFCSFGLLYFIFTLFIESVLWLKPTARTILFWVFILVELTFLTKYILLPLSKLAGFQKGISLEDASSLIGKHFNEVDDKLLNVLQLNNDANQSELLLASIEQKSKNLAPIPFKKAINFSANSKYLKYLAIPFVIWLVAFISGNNALFSDSYNRVIHHQIAYEPPAPFTFVIKNKDLNVIEGKSITLEIETQGNLIPEDVSIHFNHQNYFVQSNGLGTFEYTFSSIQEPIQFFVASNEVRSKEYNISVIPTPIIIGLEMWLDYPFYTKKQDELIKNTGNAIVPKGTKITWKLKSKNTNKVSFSSKNKEAFTLINKNEYELNKKVLNKVEYQISTSNIQLQNYETLDFVINVIKDKYPKIDVRSDIDSITHGPVQFAGQLSDDYGLSKLQLVYYNQNDKAIVQKLELPIQHSGFAAFYYVFPDGIDLQEGINYELYFEVFDNDAIHGSKSTKSKTFSYYKNTEQELKNELLNEQQEAIEDLEKSIEKNKKAEEDFQKLQESLQNKSEMNWNDQKKLENMMQRQQQYENMMQRQTEKINETLEKQPKSQNKTLEEKKKDIQQRLKEAEKLTKQEKLLEELKKLAEKLDKEKLTEKLKKLTENNRQNERNLERLLELTKRFYVEQKANQLKEKLEELAKKQEELSKNEENTSEKQEELNAEFDQIKKDLDALDKENKKLQKPMSLPKTDKDEKAVDKEMNDAKEKLEESEKSDTDGDNSSEEKKEQSKKAASKKQKSAAQKMKQMAQKMQNAIESMQGESMDEDIAMLRAVLENLIAFSFQQEDLMADFSGTTNAHPDYSKNLKKQHVLQEYFEHIDDSLYTLSMRQPKIGAQIFKDLSDVHYHLEESLIHFADNQFNVGLSDQQFVMTSTNNIAYLLSNILNGMQNASPSIGKGNGDSFSLPNIIQKQGETIEKMEEGMKKGKKPGDKKGEEGQKKPGEEGKSQGEGEGESMNGELYEIYKQQAELRRMLEESLKNKKGNDGGVGENALKQMEQLEQDILEKGFTNEVLQKMMQLKHELLKLEEAAYEQGEDTKRESNTNNNLYKRRTIKELDRQKLWFNQNEILNRQSLPLRSHYKKKVQEYFRVNDSIQ